MPSNLLLNTQSTAGYNKSLKKASSDMKLEVNKSVNLEMKSVGVRHTNGGSSKINRRTSNLLNKFNATSTEVQMKTKSSTDETSHNVVSVALAATKKSNS